MKQLDSISLRRSLDTMVKAVSRKKESKQIIEEKTEERRLREIPYNYTSFTDKEIVGKILDDECWRLINKLRKTRKTGISARMLFEILGDIWVVNRNPYLQDDLLQNPKRWKAHTNGLHHRLDQIYNRLNSNKEAEKLLSQVRNAIKEFESWFAKQKSLRQKTIRAISKHTRKDNIRFDGLARVSHASDASDWRIELPFVVIAPDHESEVRGIVAACIKLGLTIIPRGGGTGYTGSSVPIFADTALINTEKLQRLEHFEQHLSGKIEYASVEAGAGVVTKEVSKLAEAKGFVFAVDPTSQTASTIGGNIAMNAGGKKAVLWGTTIDNLLSWKMVTPDARWIRIDRVGHNHGKIHQAEKVVFKIYELKKDGKTETGAVKTIEVPGKIFRKEGLGKDVTDKFLAGIPGVQKEGCDGFITSAVFILHKMPAFTHTFCLEFFGHDLKEAVPTIVEITNFIEKNKDVRLAGLEHLDERYVKAIKYNTKASRAELPKMVLIGDLTSGKEKALNGALSSIEKMAAKKSAACFVAKTPQARRNFWHDRSRTAAIAAHTNAFKINEDVVIPLNRLYEYNEGIESINIEYSIKNKLDTLDATLEYLSGETPELLITKHLESSQERRTILSQKIKAAIEDIKKVQNRWQTILKNLEAPASKSAKVLTKSEKSKIKAKDHLKDLFLRRDIRVSYKIEVEMRMKELFSGSELETLRKKLDSIHAEARSGRLFVATHMHAGDGNVHTNIPVNSHDYKMMQNAHQIVQRVMKLANSLDGVISGEHGIGITKFDFLDKTEKIKFAEYKKKIDPHGRFNRGKLLEGAHVGKAYTPSLRLVRQEAIIMEQSELGELNDMIAHCLRCGKCKPECTTHVPRANLLYAPRNKIVGASILIEAFLYEEQTRRGLSLEHFNEFNDISDHCTVCHRCFKPCPVNIDFGDVSMRMRNILMTNDWKLISPVSNMALSFLNTSSSGWIRLLRQTVFRWGFRVQRLIYRGMKNTKAISSKEIPASTTGRPTITSRLVNSVKKPLPALPKEVFRHKLKIDDPRYIPVIRRPDVKEETAETVFFFPGCGIERLFTDVAFASLALLYDLGVQIVLPAQYTCCGAPQAVSGDAGLSKKITVENRVAFHRVANTLNYLDIKTVLVACGTCLDQLVGYQFDKIFPGSKLLDIHEFLLAHGRKLKGKNKTEYLLHDPCHTPMKTGDPVEITSKLMGKQVTLADRCCAESGLFAVSRPDISTQARFSKLETLKNDIQTITEKEKVKPKNIKLLTTCPSCLQGLARYTPETGVKPTYIATEMAQEILGKNWQRDFINSALKNGIHRVLL